MDHFIDTSVLVSWYVKETLTDKTMRFLEENSHRLYISRLVETEFYAAIAMKKRVGELSKSDCNHISTLFQKHLTEKVFEMIYLTD
jgi:predicted nucleic acid-binding protein